MTSQGLYNQLKQIDLFRDKISVIPNGGRGSCIIGECIQLCFHDNLTILITVDEYHDESYVEYNRSTHCHIENEEVIEELEYLISGNMIFIEKKGWLDKDFRIVEIIEKEDFDKKKAEILSSKQVKVYSALGMIYSSE